MTKEEEQRINKFIVSILKSDKRMATQLPGEEEHTIIIPIEEITNHWRDLVKDLEAMKDEQKD